MATLARLIADLILHLPHDGVGTVRDGTRRSEREFREASIVVQLEEVPEVTLSTIIIEDAVRLHELIIGRVASDRLQDNVLDLRAVHRRHARIPQDHLAVAGVIDSLHILTTLLEHPTDIVRGIVGQYRGREERSKRVDRVRSLLVLHLRFDVDHLTIVSAVHTSSRRLLRVRIACEHVAP